MASKGASRNTIASGLAKFMLMPKRPIGSGNPKRLPSDKPRKRPSRKK